MVKAVIQAVLSVLAITIGVAVIVWFIYNVFIERQPEYERPPLAAPLGIGPIMLGTGIYWGRESLRYFFKRKRATCEDPSDSKPISP